MLIAGGRSSVAWATTKALVRRRDTVLGTHRLGPRVLLALPFLVAGAVALVFAATLGPVVVGVLLWGAAGGVQDSTVKALVADLVPRDRRATAYGIFAGVQGLGALIGGIAAGALYERSLLGLIVVVAIVQVVALLLLAPVTRRTAAERT